MDFDRNGYPNFIIDIMDSNKNFKTYNIIIFRFLY